jgi:hypothetical protein
MNDKPVRLDEFNELLACDTVEVFFKQKAMREHQLKLFKCAISKHHQSAIMHDFNA